MDAAEAFVQLHEYRMDHTHDALHARVEVLETWMAAHMVAHEAPAQIEEVIEATEEVEAEGTESMGENDGSASQVDDTEAIAEVVEEMHEQAEELVYTPDTMPRPNHFLINHVARGE